MPDTSPVVINLPPPISVNKMRRIDWKSRKLLSNWRHVADGYVMAAKTRSENPLKFNNISRFEVHIVLDEFSVRCDADNACKILIDYLDHIDVIENDAPRNMRKITVEWGLAPTGCRVTITPLPPGDFQDRPFGMPL